MKIMIVAPDLVGVEAINEVRRVQQWHDVVTLYGTVTADDIYRAVQEKAFDVLHFATHGGPEGVLLSDGVTLPAEDIAQFLRLRETPGVFFSACQTGRLAAYCVRHGARWAISSEIDLADADAWKLAAAFYSHQRNGHAKDFVGAYLLADSGDGDYALHVDGQGAGTQALVLGPWMLLTGDSLGLTRDLLMTLAWAINIAVAEAIIHARSRAPRRERAS